MSTEKLDSDLNLINQRRVQVVQEKLFKGVKGDGAFDEKAVEAITCYILNLKTCGEIPTIIPAGDLFERMKTLYDNEPEMSEIERAELNRFLSAWKIKT